MKYFMPVKVVVGDNALTENKELLQLGKKALIVSGKSSGITSGATGDVIKALESRNIEYEIYDKVGNNPTVENCFEGGMIAKRSGADFIIGIGGGSPLDASKAIAAYAVNDMEPMDIYGQIKNKPLPIAAVPTTAGTGSEVTPYAILTVDSLKTKLNFKSEDIFPKVAFLDAKYTKSLPENVAVNTGLDAMCHAIESLLSKRNCEQIEHIALKALCTMKNALRNTINKQMSDKDRLDMLYASTLAGMAIAHTGTLCVHFMGYNLTYFKGLPHGRANGLLSVPFMKLAQKHMPMQCKKIFDALSLSDANEFESMVSGLLGEGFSLSKDEAEQFAKSAFKNKSVSMHLWNLSESEIKDMYMSI